MTQSIDRQDLVDFDAVSEASTPIARISLEPTQISKLTNITFIQGFDGLDYLTFATIELGQSQASYLVRHQNAPEPGTLIYVGQSPEGIGLRLLETLTNMGLENDCLDWINPDFKDQIAKYAQNVSFRTGPGNSESSSLTS